MILKSIIIIFEPIMIKVKAFIERGNDGTYGVYVDLEENRLNYTVIGDGKTVEEAIEDFEGCYKDMRKSFEKDNQYFQEVEFEYHYDTASFLEFYTTFFSLAGLSRLTGIHQGQLSHYVTGRKHPTRQTVEKIRESVHAFGRNLCQVDFV